MKKILTLATIAIFATSFANASTGMGGKENNIKVKTTSKISHVKYTKISSKDFSIKKMQDTKDVLMPVGGSNSNIADFFTTKAS